MELPRSRLREVAASSLKVGLSTMAGLVGWIVAGKILALELGAAGVGAFGLLRQLLQNLNVISTFAGSTALVQGIASRSGEAQVRYTRSVGNILALGGGLVAAALLVGAPWVGPWLVPHPQAAALLRWIAVAVLATSAQTYFTGLLSAHRAVNALVRSQLLGPLAALLLAYPMARLVRANNPAGLGLMLAAPGAAVALGAMRRARRSGWYRLSPLGRICREDVKAFFATSSVLLSTGLLVTGTQYLLNRLVAEQMGLEHSGQFWVAWTLSMTYVGILLGSYGTYYMPALSALTEQTARHALIRDYLRLALVVMPVLVSLVIVIKPAVVLGMFSAELLPALKVMRWMLIGDFLKGISWVLAFPMLAFNDMKAFFWTEAAFNSALAGTSWAWLAAGGSLEGLGVVFLVLYAVYLPLMWAYLAGRHRFRLHTSELFAFLAGLALVAGVSRLVWEDLELRLAACLTFLGLSAIFVLLIARGFRWTVRARA